MTNYNQTTTVCDEQQKPVKWWNRINHKYIWAVVISAIIALVWVVSPIDAIPDVFVGVGWIDDAIVALAPVFALCFKGISGMIEAHKTN